MYEDHFGLSERPFQLTPDPKYWFDSATHRKAMAYLGYGLAQGEGFIVITGDIGAGKTTLVGHLTARIDPANLRVISLVSSAIEADDLLRVVANGLGVSDVPRNKADLLAAIERGLNSVARTGRRTLLIVDEAQALPLPALEELRMLSNFQAGGKALLQIFLLGQPEFRERLHGSYSLEQLRQRVIALHHLEPMGEEEVAAFPLLYRATGGVPRRVNQLMGRVMLHAAIAGTTLIDAALIEEVQADAARDLPSASAPSAERTTIVGEGILAERIAALEARIAEQDAALRRVLTLLVDWVENEPAPAASRLEAVRGAAA